MDTNKESEKLSLLEYINANCEYVDKNEHLQTANRDYRAVFRIIGNELIVYVFDIGARGDIYKKLDV